jgi:hypothetical protein
MKPLIQHANLIKKLLISPLFSTSSAIIRGVHQIQKGIKEFCTSLSVTSLIKKLQFYSPMIQATIYGILMFYTLPAKLHFHSFKLFELFQFT